MKAKVKAKTKRKAKTQPETFIREREASEKDCLDEWAAYLAEAMTHAERQSAALEAIAKAMGQLVDPTPVVLTNAPEPEPEPVP